MGVVELWLPIVVSSALIWVVSAIVWMVLPHHKADIKALPDEKGFIAALAPLNLSPGIYMYPGCGEGESMSSPEYQARYNAGPWGSININPGKPNFGANLMLVLLLYIILGVFVAYITGQARAAGAGFMPVFQIAGATAVMGYCVGQVPGAIFMGKPTRFIITDLIDGAVYGVLTGLTFAFLWPAAPQTVKEVLDAATGG